MLVTEKLLYEERKLNKKENRVFYACEMEKQILEKMMFACKKPLMKNEGQMGCFIKDFVTVVQKQILEKMMFACKKPLMKMGCFIKDFVTVVQRSQC